MKIEEILSQVMTEISRAEEKHPNWPTDLVRGALIVCEESGELAQAVNNYDAVPEEQSIR